jgi:hypothetical protein
MARGVFSLNRVYKKQFQNVNDGNFESWPESATYGYFGGGQDSPGFLNTIDRIDFSSETLSLPGADAISVEKSKRSMIEVVGERSPPAK